MTQGQATTSATANTLDEGLQAKARRRSPVSTKLKIKRLLWAGVEGTIYRWSFHSWNGWRRMLLRMFGARIGNACMIRRTARVYYPWNFALGDLSSLGDRAEVYCLGLIEIGKRVTISQEAYLCGGTHDYASLSMPLITLPIFIGDDAWICARAFVSPGVRVGEGGIVAACGVAVKDVAPWTIVGGNPAKFIKERPKLGQSANGTATMLGAAADGEVG